MLEGVEGRDERKMERQWREGVEECGAVGESLRKRWLGHSARWILSGVGQGVG